MSDSQNKRITLELNTEQLETVKCLFSHNDWDLKVVSETVVPETGGNTQDTNLEWLKRDIMPKCVMNLVRQ